VSPMSSKPSMKARAKLSNSAELCNLGFGYRSFDRFGLGLSMRRNPSPLRSGRERHDAPFNGSSRS
jgi:hypothetical protein